LHAAIENGLQQERGFKMEIHPPHAAITRVKDFFLQLLTITVGILIALSLDGLLEWHSHNRLVGEARANLTREIQDNKKSLGDALQHAPEVQQNLQQALALIEARRKHEKPAAGNMNLSYGIVELSSATWDTARATGAMAYMDYAEAKKYSEVYELQQRLNRIQDDLLANFITSLPPQGPSEISPAELLAAKQSLLRTLAYLKAGEDVARGLIREYSKATSAPPS
jgi:hypothetical protein